MCISLLKASRFEIITESEKSINSISEPETLSFYLQKNDFKN